jgi:hypothetical protein
MLPRSEKCSKLLLPKFDFALKNKKHIFKRQVIKAGDSSLSIVVQTLCLHFNYKYIAKGKCTYVHVIYIMYTLYTVYKIYFSKD